MQASKDEFEKRGILAAVISFALPEKLVVYQEDRGWPFLLLSDPELASYSHFELGKMSWLQLLGPATFKRYVRLILKGRRFHYYGKDDYRQGGGDFILDRQGTILYAHRSQNPADRPTPEALLEALGRAEERESGRMGDGETRRRGDNGVLR